MKFFAQDFLEFLALTLRAGFQNLILLFYVCQLFILTVVLIRETLTQAECQYVRTGHNDTTEIL
jgi:hypothetical protein